VAKAVIIGCGRIAGFLDGRRGAPLVSHASAYAETRALRVAEYVDLSADKARALARKYRSDSFGTDIRGAMARHRPEVVSICTPDATHFDVAAQVLRAPTAPRVIFLEKPACSTLSEFARLKRLGEARGTVMLVNHSRRFDRRYERLRDEIALGRYGRLVRADIFYYGGWMHNGSHVIDTLRFLFGGVKLLTAGPGAPSRHAGDRTKDALLLLKKGARAQLHGFDEACYQLFDFDFKFERFRLRIENFESRWIGERRVKNGPENVLVPARWEIDSRGPAPLKRALTAIARFLTTGDPAPLKPYTLAESEGTMRILWEAEGL
jgi:predicted dehydrogenase